MGEEPLRLYYFTSARHGLEAIRDERIKISFIDQVNDPFEFLGLRLDREQRGVINRVKSKMSANRGMVCLSKDWKNPLLWAHYADKYRGVCLGFDVPQENYLQVRYEEERLTLQSLGIESLWEFTECHMQTLISTKFSAWSYEQEYRGFCSLDEPDPISRLYFLPFSPKLILKSVFVGSDSDVSRQQLIDLLGTKYAQTETFKVRPAFKTFEVVENKLRRAWK
jgi:hypothetical protein